MNPKFTISADPLLDLIEIEMSGFFEQADICQFEAARNEAHRQLRFIPNEHLTLVDIRFMLIQSQMAVTQFKMILENPIYRSKRIAIVVSRTLARMQIHRAAANRDAKYFSEDRIAAKEWLIHGRD